MKLELSGHILEKYSDNQISWKSDPWEPSRPMHMDRQTDTIKLIVTFCNFANMRKT